jgi:ABC-2 type transport system permease protein
MTTVQPSPTIHKPTRARHLRLVGALATKDIVDALKTKTTLTTIVIALLMVLFYRYFPLLTSSGDTLNVLLYTESGSAQSALVTALERSPALALYTYDSRARLMDVFPGAEDVELAVVIEETAVAQQQAGEPVTLDGYVMYWVPADKRAELKALVEEDLSAQLGQPVTLDLTGHDVYFDADTFFFVFSSTIALLFITVMIGISLIPNLMIEEKQAKTLDALLVSPASAAHLVAGKAIAGLFYGLLGSAVVLLVFRYLIIQWNLAITAAVLSTLFMTAVGLLLGSSVNVRAQLQLVAWFVILPLLMPVILVALEGLVPEGAIAVMNWIPTVLMAQIFRLSLTPNATFAHYGAALAVVAASTLALLALVVWVVRRQDRG